MTSTSAAVLHKSDERRGTFWFQQKWSVTVKISSHRDFLQWNFLHLLMNFEDEADVSWEETFWAFNLSLRCDVLQSHKETTSNHLIVMNSIHIQPLGCWCISKACFGLLLSPHCFLNPVIQAWGKRGWRQLCFPPRLVCKTLTLSPLRFHYGPSIYLWAFHFWHCSPHSLQTADSHTHTHTHPRPNIVQPLWLYLYFSYLKSN